MTDTAEQPKLVATVAQLRDAISAARGEGKRIGLVPTMGALHEGHLSLVRASQAECDYTVVTIFVNPSQFGPGEDLDQYPRSLKADLDALAQHNVQLVFAPPAEEVYPAQFDTWVEVGSVSRPLEGECRPGHFRGVATVVLKLLNMAGADVAYFGQKDYQQARVIKRLVEDLNVPTRIEICPTVREADGLAMSSRNAYLSPAARERALVLYESLCLAADLIAEGNRDAAAIVDKMKAVILTVEDAKIDYVALVDPDTLVAIETIDRPVLAVLAVRMENTRLIDNRMLKPPR